MLCLVADADPRLRMMDIGSEAGMEAPLAPSSVPLPRRHGHVGIIAFLGAMQALTLTAGFARWKVVALLLGPSGMGVASIIDQVAQVVVQVGSLSLPLVALRFLSIARAERPAGFGSLYGTLMRLMLAGTVVMSSITLVAYLVRPALFGRGLAAFPVAVLLGVAAVPHTGAANLLRNALSTLERYRSAAIVAFWSSVALAAATFVGIRVGGLDGLYAGSWVVAAGTHLVLYALIRRQPLVRNRSSDGTLRSIAAQHPEVLRFLIPVYVVGFTIPLSYSVVRLTVLHDMGAEQVGYLAAAFTIATSVRSVLNQGTAQFLTPIVSRPGPVDARASAAAEYVRSLSLFALAVVLPLVLFPHEIVFGLFSRKFAPAISFLFLFVLAEVVLLLGDAYRVLLIGLGDTTGFLMTTLSATVLLTAGVVLTVPRFGVLGAGAAHLTGGIFALLASFVRLRGRHQVTFARRTLIAPAFCATALAIGGLLGRALADPGAMGWALKSAYYVAACGASLSLLSSDERGRMRSALRHRVTSLR